MDHQKKGPHAHLEIIHSLSASSSSKSACQRNSTFIKKIKKKKNTLAIFLLMKAIARGKATFSDLHPPMCKIN